jgi:hypothetical protein
MLDNGKCLWLADERTFGVVELQLGYVNVFKCLISGFAVKDHGCSK